MLATPSRRPRLGWIVTSGSKTAADPTTVLTNKERVVLTMGNISDGGTVLARAYSACLTDYALFSMRFGCGNQLQAALSAIAREGQGHFSICVNAPHRLFTGF